MRQVLKWLRTTGTAAVAAGAGAVALMPPSHAEGQTIWYPYYECVITGRCYTSTTVCGTATNGAPCRYCALGLQNFECEFNLFENCYDTSTPVINCGLQYSGVCNGAGLCVGAVNGVTCPRYNCF